MLQPSGHHILAAPTVSPEEIQGGNRTLRFSCDPLQTPTMMHPEETQDEKTFWPQRAEGIPRNDVSKPRVLHLSHA